MTKTTECTGKFLIGVEQVQRITLPMLVTKEPGFVCAKTENSHNLMFPFNTPEAPVSGTGAAVNAKFVHIDVLPAMTGVSRFGEMGPLWRYSKVRNGPPSR